MGSARDKDRRQRQKRKSEEDLKNNDQSLF